MKRIHIYITVLLAGVALSSCNFTDVPFDKFDQEFVFNANKKAEGYVLVTYQVLPFIASNNNGFKRVNGAMLSSATDESMITVPGSTITMLNDGSLTARSTNPDACWIENYRYIRDANIGLEGLEGLPETSHDDKLQWQAELQFLKAFAYFEILKRYGGFPIVDRPYTLTEDMNVPRSSFADCVTYILGLLDKALPDLRTPNDVTFGRASKGTALALKARVLLYAASPLFNGPGYDGTTNPLICYGTADPNRWKLAAEAAADVIKLGFYQLYIPGPILDTDTDDQVITKGTKNYRDLFITISGNNELILPRTSAVGNQVEKDNLPVGITNANGLISPSQQLVDAYGMVDGKARTAAGSVYNPQNPYAKRDPRFYGSIFYNGMTWGSTQIQTYTGGAHNKTPQSTKTGYYMSKFCSSSVAISGTVTTTKHCFPLIRYAEVLLNYAEAVNEANGPDVDPYSCGLTARGAVKLVRSRVLRPSQTDVAVAVGDKAAMRIAIHEERRIELAFEDHRYFDLKRWKEAETVLNQNIQGMTITQNGSTFTYTPKNDVDIRKFATKLYLYPLPSSEVDKNAAIDSNNPQW